MAALAAAALLSVSCREPAGPAEDRTLNQLAVSLATVPPKFADQTVASGLSSPTAMAFAPDGRLFIAEKGGRVRILKGGSLLGTPFVTLSVGGGNERGLLGIAVDPDFNATRHVFVFHTTNTSPVRNRVLRLTANGDVATSERTVILDLNNLGSSPNHNGGALHFGRDGKLYIATGENYTKSNAQSLNTLLGKILRIDKDGSIPTDNPFYGSATGSNRAIWARGFRNPFSFAVHPRSGRIFVNDVGDATWEEINELTRGANYGWGAVGDGNSTGGGYIGSLRKYRTRTNGTCAITGGTFYDPGTVNFPSDYVGDYFYSDYCAGWIKRWDPVSGSEVNFATGTSGVVDLDVGPDGTLYYLDYKANKLGRVRYTESTAPTIATQPASLTVQVGDPAAFTVSANGTGLSYQWQRNGSTISGANSSTYAVASAQLGDDGARFRCVVSNTSGSATSNEAILTVTNNTRPTGAITAPPSGSTYRGGSTITLSGTGTDAEDGTLPDMAFRWKVDLWHDDGSPHQHPIVDLTTGVRNLTFTVPTGGDFSPNVWLRAYLTVRDAGGLEDRDSLDIRPVTSQVTLATVPTGLQVRLESDPFTAPKAATSSAGFVRSIEAVSPQTSGGRTYEFVSWSQGGSAAQSLTWPDADATYTATFREVAVSTRLFEAETAARSGPLVTTKHPGYTGTGYLDFQHSSGDWVEWTVDMASAATVPLEVRYSNGGGNMTVRIQVNGTTVNGAFPLPATGAWYAWSTASLSAALRAGANTVRLTTTGSGQPNVDHLKAAVAAPQDTPPTIASHPSDVTVTEGQTATFTVGAAGSAPLAYQWEKDNVDVPGAQAASWSFPATLSDNGSRIRCKVTNAFGMAASDQAALIVNATPPPATLYEAESAARSGPLVTTKHPGFTGTGYLDFQSNTGNWVEWTVHRAAGGSVPLEVRYSNGGSGMTVRIEVNGAVLSGAFSLPATGAWFTWRTASLPANLQAGANTVRLTTTGSGQPNVDHLKVLSP